MHYIECLGISGAGKTTLVRHLQSRCAAEAIAVADLRARAGAAILRDGVRLTVPGMDRLIGALPSRVLRASFLLDYRFTARFSEFMSTWPQFALHALEWGADVESGGPYTLAFLRTSAQWQWAQQATGPAAILIADEGFAQRAVELCLGTPTAERQAHLNRYARLAPRPSLLIRVVAPPDLALRRLARRRLWPAPLGSMTARERVMRLHAAADECDRIVEEYKKMGIPVATVDPRAPDAAAAVLCQVRHLTGAGGP